MTIYEWFSLGLALVIITHPLRLLPLFMELSIDYPYEKYNKILSLAFLTIFIAFLVSIWFGENILFMFGVTLGDFQIAGGIFLLTLGLRMMSPEGLELRNKKGDITTGSIIVPLAIPWIAGPGAFTIVIVEAHKYNTFIAKLYMSTSVLLISAMVCGLLYFASSICKFVGKDRIDATARLTGLVVLAMAVEILSQGLIRNFPALKGASQQLALLFQ